MAKTTKRRRYQFDDPELQRRAAALGGQAKRKWPKARLEAAMAHARAARPRARARRLLVKLADAARFVGGNPRVVNTNREKETTR